MFEELTQSAGKVKTDLIEIVDNYKVLHFDEFPILYFGTNKFGNKILGSHLDEDDTLEQIWVLHTIISNKEYSQFIKRRISYLDLLKGSNSICLVQKNFNFDTHQVFDIDFNSIPKGYLPLEGSFYPIVKSDFSFIFSLNLKGKLADTNKALAEEVSSIQLGFSEFIEERIKSLKGFDLKPQALLQPYTDGSFKINIEFNLNQNGNKPSLFTPHAPFNKYINEYISYLSDGLSEDKDAFKENIESSSIKLKRLQTTLAELYSKAHIFLPEDTLQVLKADIIKSLTSFEKVTEQVGTGFETMEIVNIVNQVENQIAFIDKEFSENFHNEREEIEAYKNEVTIDEEFKIYKIYIYHLNTDNRSGNALIKHPENEEEMSKPRIKITGDEPLEKTKYTESLYSNRWISVIAKAKKIGNKFSYLTIEFD